MEAPQGRSIRHTYLYSNYSIWPVCNLLCGILISERHFAAYFMAHWCLRHKELTGTRAKSFSRLHFNKYLRNRNIRRNKVSNSPFPYWPWLSLVSICRLSFTARCIAIYSPFKPNECQLAVITLPWHGIIITYINYNNNSCQQGCCLLSATPTRPHTILGQD